MTNKAGIFLTWLYGPEGGGSTVRPFHVLDFARYLENVEGSVFWNVVTEVWDTFDLIPHSEFEHEFIRFQETAPGCNGSTQLRLHRGQDADAPIGLSWTSSADVAADFARGHRGISYKDPTVLTILVHAKQVAFQCNDREEQEYVLLRIPNTFDFEWAG
jgi:hypothetical protein